MVIPDPSGLKRIRRSRRQSRIGIAGATVTVCQATAIGTPCAPLATLYYVLTQPQLPSTAAIFPLPCPGLHFVGGNGTGAAQFNRAPQVRLVVNNAGSNPNGGAVFSMTYPISLTTFENLTINGQNQAISMYTSNQNVLRNVCLTTTITGKPDNTPLKITNTFWFFMDDGCLQAGSGALPVALLTGDAPIAGEAPLVGLAYFRGLQGTGAGFQYIQRVNTVGSGPGNIVFRDIAAIESSSTSFFTVTNATGSSGSVALPTMSDLTFDNVTTSDATTATNAVLEFNSSGSTLQGVYLQNTFAGNSGQGPAIRMDAGTLQGCHVIGGSNQASTWVVDSNGNPVGGCSTENYNGFDFIVPTGNPDRLRSDLFPVADANGPAFRAAASGNRFASLAIDPVLGYMFNTGNMFGYGASLAETAAGTIDVQFATLYPPTNVSGTATMGGSLAAGTYYPTVTTTSDNCTHQSAESVQGAGVIIGGSNNAASVTWTLPVAGLSAIGGYCVNLSTTSNMHGTAYWTPSQFGTLFVSGASTNSVLLTTVPTGGQLLGDFHALCGASLYADFAGGQYHESRIQPGCERNSGSKRAEQRAEGGAVHWRGCGAANQRMPDGCSDNIERMRCTRIIRHTYNHASHHNPSRNYSGMGTSAAGDFGFHDNRCRRARGGWLVPNWLSGKRAGNGGSAGYFGIHRLRHRRMHGDQETESHRI